MSRNNRKIIATNKNAHIISRTDRTGKVRTETSRRDLGELDVAISTDWNNNATRVFIDASGRADAHSRGYADLELNGRQARMLFLALSKHFDVTGKY